MRCVRRHQRSHVVRKIHENNQHSLRAQTPTGAGRKRRGARWQPRRHTTRRRLPRRIRSTPLLPRQQLALDGKGIHRTRGRRHLATRFQMNALGRQPALTRLARFQLPHRAAVESQPVRHRHAVNRQIIARALRKAPTIHERRELLPIHSHLTRHLRCLFHVRAALDDHFQPALALDPPLQLNQHRRRQPPARIRPHGLRERELRVPFNPPGHRRAPRLRQLHALGFQPGVVRRRAILRLPRTELLERLGAVRRPLRHVLNGGLGRRQLPAPAIPSHFSARRIRHPGRRGDECRQRGSAANGGRFQHRGGAETPDGDEHGGEQQPVQGAVGC